jgi:translation initiation factor IF-3
MEAIIGKPFPNYIQPLWKISLNYARLKYKTKRKGDESAKQIY